MNSEIVKEAIDCIIVDIVEKLPNDILQCYRDVPGRSPSIHSKIVSEIASRLGDDDALILIRDVVDAAIFTVLSLFDQSFKDRNIEVDFSRADPDSVSWKSFHDIYRLRVDPGGIIVD